MHCTTLFIEPSCWSQTVHMLTRRVCMHTSLNSYALCWMRFSVRFSAHAFTTSLAESYRPTQGWQIGFLTPNFKNVAFFGGRWRQKTLFGFYAWPTHFSNPKSAIKQTNKQMKNETHVQQASVYINLDWTLSFRYK